MKCQTAIDAAAYLLLKAPFSAMPAEKLTALVYIAEREHAETHGYTFTDCERINTEDGPRHRELRDALYKGSHARMWQNILDRRAGGKLIALKPRICENHLDNLSEAIVCTLDGIWRRYGHFSIESLTGWMQSNCSEWDKNNPEGIISYKTLFETLKMPNAAERARHTEDRLRINEIFRGVRA